MSATARENAARSDEAYTELRRILTTGQDVYTILRGVSSSGMTRRISVVVVTASGIRDISWLAAAVLECATDTNHALRVQGAGMDMGFHVVYQLASRLYGDGYALNQRWI
jgi:hypothetical protein